MTEQRERYEAAVVDRLKQSGFLEIEIRTECLVRCGEGYQDEIINAGWHYWNAALAGTPSPVSNLRGDPSLRALLDKVGEPTKLPELAESFGASQIPPHVRNFLGKVQGVCLGVAISGDAHPNPDEALMELYREAQAILFPETSE